MPPICKRLNKNLTDPEREEVKQALLDYAIDYGYSANELKSDNALVEDLLPYLTKISSRWKGLEDCIEWKGSSAHSHVLGTLKNQLREKGRYFATHLKAAKKQREQPQSDSEDQDDAHSNAYQGGKALGKKRAQAQESDVEADITPGQTPMKKQKVSDHDPTVNIAEPNAEIKVQPTD